QNEWSRQHIDFVALLERVGWHAPPSTLRTDNSLSFAAQQIELGLVFANPGNEGYTKTIFGVIEQPLTQHVGSTYYLQRALSNPSEYYIGLGIAYLNQRNFDLALESFERAKAFDPESSEAWFGQSQTYMWLGNFAAASTAYQ